MRSYDVIVVGGVHRRRGHRLATCAVETFAWRSSIARIRAAKPPGLRPECFSPAPDSPSAIPLVTLGRASLALYPQFVSEIEEISGLGAGLRTDGAIEVLFSADAERRLSTLVALHRGLGLPTEPLPIDEARKLEPALGREARGAAWMGYESSVDPRALTEAVLAAAAASGVELHANTNVTRIASEDGRCNGA